MSKNKKGFTLVELLAVIAIMAVLLLIAVPVYNNVRNDINESIYDTKIQRVLSASTTYAEEMGAFVFDVQTLISEGKVEADNELGDFMDPRTNRNMKCDVINVVYENNQFYSNITENDTCYDFEELQSLYGLVELKTYRDSIEITEVNGWITGSSIAVRYELKNDYESYEEYIEEITWSGEEQKTCTKENIADCKEYIITTGEIKTLTVQIQMKIIKDGIEINNTVKKMISIDNQAPYIVEGSIAPNSELNSQSQRRMEFDLSDGDGSGIQEYAVIKSEFACDSEEYNANKKTTNNTHITEYLGNGDYRICVVDKVGNKSVDENNTFSVSNVDTGSPVINVFTITSKDTYKSLNTHITIRVTDDGGNDNLQMCLSETGYLKDCSWEKLNESFDKPLSGTLDGNKRTLYLSVQDEAGNIAQRIVEYTPYKEFTSTTKVNYSSYGACSKACGGGTQSRTYQLKDNYTQKISPDKVTETRTCNTMNCCSSKKAGSYGAWKACSKSCGGGVQYRDVNYVSNYNGQSCGTVANGSSQACNTHSCAPTMVRVGDRLGGEISPLNSTQIVQFTSDTDFTCNGKRKCKSGCDTTYCSWVWGKAININDMSVSYGPLVTLTQPDGKTTKNLGNGIGQTTTVKINDNTIAFAGANYYGKNKKSKLGLMFVKVSGNNMWVSNNIDLNAAVGSQGAGIEALDYTRGSSSVSLFYDNGTANYYKNCHKTYDMNTGKITSSCASKSNSFIVYYGRWDKEGIAGGSGIGKYADTVDYIGLNDGTGISLCNDYTATTPLGNKDSYSKAGVYVGHCSNNLSKALINGETWKEYGYALSFGHFGNDKIVIHVGGQSCTGSYKNRVCSYRSYLVFYRKTNGVWNRESVIEGPGNGTKYYGGELITLNSNTIVFNASEGLYLIRYN